MTESVEVDCSDDEIYGFQRIRLKGTKDKNDSSTDPSTNVGENSDNNNDDDDDGMSDYQPVPSRIVSLYQELEKNGFLELESRCPGRRRPTEQGKESTSQHSERKSVEESTKPSVTTKYDFFDEEFADSPTTSSTTTSTRLPRADRKRNERSLVTSLDKVLSDMNKNNDDDNV